MRIKRCILVTVILFTFHLSPFTLTAQTLPLSETAKASVITCGPGDDFYTTFGHSAIRIADTATGIDWVYNYGTFDFNTPHFYWKFMRGQLNYCLGRFSYESFMYEYQSEGRAVWEQRLNFTPQEVNNLYVALEWNYEPSNREYSYDFFRKNCATMVFDKVQEHSGHKKPVYNYQSEGMSYRDYLHLAMKDKLEWWAMGVDLLLGLPADHKCTVEEASFYPLVMQQEFAGAKREDAPLVDPSVTLLTENRDEVSDSFPPFVVFALLFALVAVSKVCDKRLNFNFSIFNLLTRILFVLAGIIGLFLLFMWFGTNHYCTEWNLNILWASPLLIWMAVYLERTPRWALWIQLVMFAVALVWVVWCHLSVAFIPLILTLALCTALVLKVND